MEAQISNTRESLLQDIQEILTSPIHKRLMLAYERGGRPEMENELKDILGEVSHRED